MAVDIHDRVAKMLAKAEGTDSEHEAEIIWGQLQKLATRHSIDLAQIRQQNQKKERREDPIVKNVTIGKRGQKGLAFYVDLFLEIARANDVKCNIFANKTGVICFGFPSDIEMVTQLYISLITRMVKDANDYLARGEHKNELRDLAVKKRYPNPDAGRMNWSTGKREPKFLYEWTYETKPMPGETVRRNFYEAFTKRISARLMDARREAIQAATDEEAVAADEAPPTDAPRMGTELVLKRKAEEIDQYYRQNSTAKGSYRGGSSARFHGGGSDAGRSSANSAHLGRADREISGPGKGIGR